MSSEIGLVFLSANSDCNDHHRFKPKLSALTAQLQLSDRGKTNPLRSARREGRVEGLFCEGRDAVGGVVAMETGAAVQDAVPLSPQKVPRINAPKRHCLLPGWNDVILGCPKSTVEKKFL
ncbi:hypothetical protein CEXT_52641 [Caerostris extrusa]|uniref:Uncharacterized protein n=1 Tax=Caerostris extrusa TaxID=172846 RepID=A0AAV4NGS4_CAEEX|nr:hypothetical protein CEXT_52641 [Caerostris extrusa]